MKLTSVQRSVAGRIIVALDVSNEESAFKLIELLAPFGVVFKIGLEVITAPDGLLDKICEYILEMGGDFFLDGKFHDIPNTVGRASRNATARKAAMFNVHVSGGIEMMKAASEAAKSYVDQNNAPLMDDPIVLGVTILTSMKYEDFERLGLLPSVKMIIGALNVVAGGDNLTTIDFSQLSKEQLKRIVVALASKAKECGLDGVVCSGEEIKAIREACGPDFKLVVPGIRLPGSAKGDQKRVVTPGEAILRGADYIVIGRELNEAENPVRVLVRIINNILNTIGRAGELIPEITNMSKEDLLELDPTAIDYLIDEEDIFHMASLFDAFWQYDYEAAKDGRVGCHALLKSGLHSDAFFAAKILLEEENTRDIIAHQMVMKLRATNPNIGTDVTCVTGVPDAASKLAEKIASILGVPYVKMKKEDGKIMLDGEIDVNRGSGILIIEDICTKATRFKEATKAIRKDHPSMRFIPLDPVILNRGGLKEVTIKGEDYALPEDQKETFTIVALVDKKFNDWPAEECEICPNGSKAIKPKVDAASWQEITNSQLPQ